MGVSVSGEGLGRIAEGIAFLKSHKVRIGIPDGGGGGSGGAELRGRRSFAATRNELLHK